ncbi:hypothetical protein [Dendronalium sp. ChiSLP03b]|uniref:hypothetical protein n=1 Tax=Dendronalium sp. ChiSLP03b TaxID=3075381 RepID=UPI002AD25A09|nr:hypothetical protein [Dendronalium sp. ChiSLP03b]MDZ8204018.1 hypothetical protein [Dendronalium sp. ChiSLP03b]
MQKARKPFPSAPLRRTLSRQLLQVGRTDDSRYPTGTLRANKSGNPPTTLSPQRTSSSTGGTLRSSLGGRPSDARSLLASPLGRGLALRYAMATSLRTEVSPPLRS